MPIQKITIQQFIPLATTKPILDVRSPGEYTHAHVPSAHSLPLFTNEQRAIVGTLYKLEGRQAAIKKGLEFFGPNMRSVVEQVEKIIEEGVNKKKEAKENNIDKKVLVHCWRGGMRSGAIAWLLDLYGFEVYLLIGGYKAFRNWVLRQFEKQYHFKILGGYTGSGKTKLLIELKRLGQPVIDLEALANHKGSAFGALGENNQPGQEMFENLLALELYKNECKDENEEGTDDKKYKDEKEEDKDVKALWLEDESQRIGLVNIPLNIWQQMRNSPVYFLDIDFEKRLEYLVHEYGKYEVENLMNAIMRIKKRLGGLEAKNAIGYLVENNTKECFRILLNYYDKFYTKALNNRENLATLLTNIKCEDVEEKTNAQHILKQQPLLHGTNR